jgi:preprotein translocase subunit SecD
MAVDANILIFERTKEELKKGLYKPAAIEEGFKRAWLSIRDSNMSTMITAGILYFFTSSFVQGFALTLGIGVLISMFSAIFVTRNMLRLFIRK